MVTLFNPLTAPIRFAVRFRQWILCDKTARDVQTILNSIEDGQVLEEYETTVLGPGSEIRISAHFAAAIQQRIRAEVALDPIVLRVKHVPGRTAWSIGPLFMFQRQLPTGILEDIPPAEMNEFLPRLALATREAAIQRRALALEAREALVADVRGVVGSYLPYSRFLSSSSRHRRRHSHIKT